MKKTFYLMLSILTALLPLQLYANNNSVEQDIGASAQFRQALAVSNVKDVNFGIVEYTENAGATTIGMFESTTNKVDVSNTTDYTHTNQGFHRGEFIISGTAGETVDISCSENAFLSDGSNILEYHWINIRIHNNGYDYYDTCNGLNNVIKSHIIQNTANNNLVVIGGRMRVPNTGIAAPGAYNTYHSGGVPLKFRVIYQ